MLEFVLPSVTCESHLVMGRRAIRSMFKCINDRKNKKTITTENIDMQNETSYSKLNFATSMYVEGENNENHSHSMNFF